MRRARFNMLMIAAIAAGGGMGRPAAADGLAGAYLGGNFGRARNTYDTSFIDTELVNEATNGGATVNITARSIARMSDIWWFDAGYFFTPNIGVDAAFFHLGEIRYIAVGSISGSGHSLPLSSTTEVTSHGPALSLVLRLPLTEAFDVSLRLGDYFGKATIEDNVTVGANSDFVALDKRGSSLLVGVGASYSFAGHYSVRMDFLRVNDTGDSGTTGKFSVNMATVGVSYTF